jgi:predicted Fe-S protein YdhL (DUF1289 family)
MPNDSPAPPPITLTPCVGLCRLDGHGYCVGCHRSGAEIARWRAMPDSERLYLMRVVLPARKVS